MNVIRQWVQENFGHEAVEEIDRYMAGRGSNVILVYADDHTFEVLGGLVTNRSLTIDSMIEQLGIDMDEFAAWKGWVDWDYDSLIMINTDQWNRNKIVDETVEYLKMTAEIRALNGHTDFLKSARVYAGLKIKAKYPWLSFREFKEIVERCVEECEDAEEQGNADDVCEYKEQKNKFVQHIFTTSCGKDIIQYGLMFEYNYCPYCGKKIKVMEKDGE